MQADTVIAIVKDVGFPIAVSAALFWYIVRENQSNREAINSLKEEVKDFTEAMTDFKKVLSLFYQKLTKE